MGPGVTLIQSSPTTRSWLHGLRDRLPQLEYSETEYWASFRSEPPRKVVAYLNPAKRSVRLFLPLEAVDEPLLQPTPSTSSWAVQFPSIFPIVGEEDLATATRLIVKAYGSLRPSTRKKATLRPEYFAAEELSSEIEYLEGAARSVVVNAYERNRVAREKCLRHHGRTCAVCRFDFEAGYGEAAAGYIQVHHIVPIATVRKEYCLNPITDLRPVCPNCHAVIHRREPPFSIEEVRQMLQHDGALEPSATEPRASAKARRPKKNLATDAKKTARD